MLRIPGARPLRRRQEVQSREQSWDNRFHLGKLPTYDALDDPHCNFHSGQNFQKIIKTKKKIVLAPGKIRRAKNMQESPSRLPKSSSSKAVRNKKPSLLRGQIFKKFKDELRNAWEEREIPIPQREVFLSIIEALPPKAKASAMAREVDDLLRDKSIVQYVLRDIQTREMALPQLQILAEKLAREPESHELQKASVEALSAFRIISIKAVESIQSWREQMSAYDPANLNAKKVPFIWEGHNYLLKMKSDLNFLQTSPLSMIFEFSTKSDPFMVYASSALIRKGRGSKKMDIPIPTTLLKRIRQCEMLLVEEVINTSEDHNQTRETPFELRRKKMDFDTNTARNATIDRSSLSGTGDSILSSRSERASSIKALQQIQLDTQERVLEIKQPSQSKLATPKSVIPVPEIVVIEEDIHFEFINESDIQSAISKYMETVPNQIIASLGTASFVYTKSMELRYPCFLWAKFQNRNIGLVVLNLEVQKTLQKRLNLTHISAISIPIMGTVLKVACKYIWLNYPCIEIRVCINQRETAEGKYEADKDIKARLDELGFRWRTLTYSGDGKPVQVLGLRRPEGVNCENPTTEALFNDCLQINHACAIQVSNQDEEEEANGSTHSMLALATALREIGRIQPSSEEAKSVEEMISKIPGDFRLPAIKLLCAEDPKKALKDIESLGIQMPNIEDRLAKTSAACISLGLSWPKFITTKLSLSGNSVPYTKIYDTQISCALVSSFKVYIIPTEDENFSLFIIPGLFESNFFTTAQDILSQISSISEVKEEIWLPCVSILKEESISSIVGQPHAEGKVVACCEVCDLKITAPLHPLGYIHIQPNPDALIIDGDFLLGLMHSKVDETLEIPYFVINVRKLHLGA